MTTRFTKSLFAALLVGAASLATAHAADPRSMLGQDRYDYTFHNGNRDTYTDGARSGERAQDMNGAAGSAVQRQSDWMPDGNSHPAAIEVPFGAQLAGMDRTGVSAPPDGKHTG